MNYDNFYFGLNSVNSKTKHDVNEILHKDINWDLPVAIDFKSAYQAFKSLKEGKSAKMPLYDMVTSTRIGFQQILPKGIILIEGIFGLYDQKINQLYDLKLFV